MRTQAPSKHTSRCDPLIREVACLGQGVDLAFPESEINAQ
jgi:hypothetical protein